MKDIAAIVTELGGFTHTNEVGIIESVELASSQVEDADLAMFGDGIVSPIAYLSLTSTNITDRGIEELSKFPFLEVLTIGATNITGEGFCEDGFKSLRHLSLRGCQQLTAAGIARIASCGKLEKLTLDDSNIDDTLLEPIGKMPGLEILRASYTAISDRGLPHLYSLSSLKWLSLDKTKVTYEGMSELFKRLPGIDNGLIM